MRSIVFLSIIGVTQPFLLPSIPFQTHACPGECKPLASPQSRSSHGQRTKVQQPLYSTNFGTLGAEKGLLGDEGEDDIPWYEALQDYAETQPNDPLLRGLDGLTWTQFKTRAENEWITARVESEEDRDRLSSKLEALLEVIKAYFYAHILLEAIIDPSSNEYDNLFMARERLDAFSSGQHIVIREQERYYEAHVDFWAELAAVLKSQEDVPIGLPQLDQVRPLPAPFGQSANGIITLPMPSLLDWKQDDFGGAEDQIASLLIFKARTLPALQAFRRQPTLDTLKEYATLLGRVFRKAGRWFGADPESTEFVESLYRDTRGRLGTQDPGRTGLAVPGGYAMERRGIEDDWLEQ